MLWKASLRQALKVALGAAAAIALAQTMGLEYSVTAGIITILSIQNTKRETFRLVWERLQAFVVAAVLAFGCFTVMGYHLGGFALYLFFYTLVCVRMGWLHALAMVSVLMSHFLTSGAMTWPSLGNEAMLYLIGSLCGVAVNLDLRPDKRRMDELAGKMDEEMVTALRALADLPGKAQAAEAALEALRESLAQAETMARRNRMNTWADRETEDERYVHLRQAQFHRLEQIRDTMRELQVETPQQLEVAAFLREVAASYRRDNDVVQLLSRLSAVLEGMRNQPLPATRAEFESRALLYGVLLRVEDFLQLKRQYAQTANKKPKRSAGKTE